MIIFFSSCNFLESLKNNTVIQEEGIISDTIYFGSFYNKSFSEFGIIRLQDSLENVIHRLNAGEDNYIEIIPGKLKKYIIKILPLTENLTVKKIDKKINSFIFHVNKLPKNKNKMKVKFEIQEDTLYSKYVFINRSWTDSTKTSYIDYISKSGHLGTFEMFAK